jgi:subtilisin
MATVTIKRLTICVIVTTLLIVGVVIVNTLSGRGSALAGQKPDDDYQSNLLSMKQAAGRLPRAKGAELRFNHLKMKVEKESLVRVIVRLRATFTPEGNLAKATAINAQRALIKQAGDSLLEEVQGYDATTVKRYDTLPFVGVTVNLTGIESLRASSMVIDIQEDRILRPNLKDSTKLIGAVKAWGMNARGQGQTIAVLDTGVDKNHPFLSSKVVSEACFSSNYSMFSVSSLCPGGAEVSTEFNSGMPCPPSVDGCGHGTHVAGIAAGRGSGFSGVAPDANIIAIQVFTRFDRSGDCYPGPAPCIGAYTTDIIGGLNRVYELRKNFSIASVNMSLGGGEYSTNCDELESPTKSVIDNLRSVGIATVVASGNEAYKNALASPACISTAVSVGATFSFLNDETVEFYSNSAAFLTLLAPGGLINSAVPGGGYDSFSGTSMAAPHVAGAFALLKSVAPAATVTRLLNALVSTGTGIRDSENNLVKPRIQVDKAVQSLGPVMVGNLDRADCSVISGWVADRNRPDVALSVRIFDGNTLVTTVQANSYRSDIANHLGDGGYHGFSLSTPSVFRDGKSHSLRVQYDSTNQNIPNGQKTVSCQPDYVGNIERIDCNTISGWVADRNRPNVAITVRIYDDTKLVSTVTANQVRADLINFLGDNGAHGFSISTPEAFKDGKAHTIRLRYETSTSTVTNGSKSITCGPSYVGNLDTASCSNIIGWAADRNRLNTSIRVKIFDGEKLLQTVTANLLRPDVGSVLKDNGLHGFNLATPAVFKDGKPHTVRLRYEDSNTSLSSSPKSLQCNGK